MTYLETIKAKHIAKVEAQERRRSELADSIGHFLSFVLPTVSIVIIVLGLLVAINLGVS